MKPDVVFEYGIKDVSVLGILVVYGVVLEDGRRCGFLLGLVLVFNVVLLPGYDIGLELDIKDGFLLVLFLWNYAQIRRWYQRWVLIWDVA